MEEKLEFVKKPEEGGVWDTIIIGSGPAGLTAAIYTTRGAASTLILGGEKWGGQLMLTSTVDNFPGFPEGIQGPELMAKMRKQAERFGAEFVEKNAKSIEIDKKPFTVKTDEKTYLARSVVIATGSATRWLGVPGEDRLRGRGVSSCAPCDAPFFKDKKVVVVGGGDSAMEEALVLSKYALGVTIIHRRDELRASKIMQEKVVKNKKINIVWDTDVIGMLGDNLLSSVKLKTKINSEQARKIKAGGLDSLGAKITEEKEDGLIWEMPTSGLFVAIGHKPLTDIFKGKIETDEKGYIKKTSKEITEGDGENMYNSLTNVEGIFVAGDVHDHTYEQAITAAGFGCMAGLDVLRYLEK